MKTMIGGLFLIIFATVAHAQTPPASNWKLEDDQRHVTVTFPSTPPATLRFDVAGITDILARLGEFRSLMWPGEPKIFKLGQVVPVIRDPFWSTEPIIDSGDTLLHIRDPRYGWLHYSIPREEARKLAAYIQVQVNAPLPQQFPAPK